MTEEEPAQVLATRQFYLDEKSFWQKLLSQAMTIPSTWSEKGTKGWTPCTRYVEAQRDTKAKSDPRSLNVLKVASKYCWH